MSRTNEAAFETVIEAHLLANGYTPVSRDGFDRERAIFPDVVLGFIRDTQPREGARWKRCPARTPARRSSPTCASGWMSTACLRRCVAGSSTPEDQGQVQVVAELLGVLG